MAEQITPYEYVDKAFGLNIDGAFDIDTAHMPEEIQRFVALGTGKRIHFGGIEKQGAKAFRTMVEKRSATRAIIPSPLVVVHRELGTTNDKFDYRSISEQYKDLAGKFEARIFPAVFSLTIQIFARKDQRSVLDILTGLINAWLYEHHILKVPHVVEWMEGAVTNQEELELPLDLSLTDVQNAAWTPVIEGHYLGVEKGQEASTVVVVSNVITPTVVDFNFVGVESI